jgi:hypothetical protein
MGGAIMKIWIVLAACLLIAGVATTQDLPEFWAEVGPESVLVRRLPTTDGEHVASLFEDEIVEVVSRSLDGQWFEVRRIGRRSSLGWVRNDLLNWDFLHEQLPLGDNSTGVEGMHPLSDFPPIGVFLEEAPILRELPLRNGRRIMALPPLIVVPVVGRNADASWLQVNYLGHLGWINRTTIRQRPDLDWRAALTVPPGTPPPDSVAAVIIPVELQQAQVDRLRGFINDRIGLAYGLESFWWRVFRGEVMPCDAPPEVLYYPYIEQDIVELPELGRYIPRLVEAVDYLMTAREPLLTCGVVAPDSTIRARNGAVNARVIFEATLERLAETERILQARR